MSQLYGHFGFQHNQYTDAICQRFFANPPSMMNIADQCGDHSPIDRIRQIIEDMLRYPAPPFNPGMRPTTPEWPLLGVDPYTLPSCDASQSGNHFEFETRLNDEDRKIISKLPKWFEKAESDEDFLAIREKSYSGASKAGWVGIGAVVDIGIASSHYWRDEFPQRPWVQTYLDFDLRRAGRAWPWKKYGKADLKGALTGLFTGGLGGAVTYGAASSAAAVIVDLVWP